MRSVLDDNFSRPTTAMRVTLGSAEPDKTNPGKRIDSINDHQWQEQVVDPSKLLNYYFMLSKIRLTGVYVCICFFVLFSNLFLFCLCSLGDWKGGQ